MTLRARGRAGGVKGRVTLKWRDHRAAIWERVSPEPNTGCWLWTAAVSSTGYGSVRLGQRTQNAHRLSYEAHVGPVPDGLSVLHKCDQRSCVNPDHLFLGTQKDNISDMLKKGRGNPVPRMLSASQVDAIKSKYETGATMHALSLEAGVSHHTISKYVRGHR